MMRVHRLLSRKRLYCAGLAYGVGAIVFSGLIVAPFPAAAAALGRDAETAHLYHYHVSAVFATLVAAGILLVAGVAASHGSFLLSLREAYRNLALLDVCAVVGGAGLAFAAGWIKEMGDAMRGRFFDQADFAANGQAILAQAGCALLLVLPVHAGVALCGDFVRRRLLQILSPSGGRRRLDKAFNVEAALLRNAAEVRQQDGLLSRLEQDLARLTSRYTDLPPAARQGAAGQALRQAAHANEEKSRRVLARLAELEGENERLRGELEILRRDATEGRAGEVALEEIDALARGGREQTLQIRTCRQRSTMAAEEVHALIDRAGAAPAGSAPRPDQAEGPEHAGERPAAGPDRRRADTAPLQDASQRTFDDLRSELEYRMHHEERMTRSIGELRARNRELEDERSAHDPQATAALEEALRILRRKVLVVDDEAGILGLYKEALTGTGLLQVFTADSAMAAVSRLREMPGPPDLILLDVRMPGLDGTEFCAALERNQKFKHIPVIFSSAYAMEEAPELATLSHVAFLQKPVELDELCDTVLAALDIAPPRTTPATSRR